ncbi:mediator complex, subunit Med10, partial [Cladochytrium replicatum]
ETLEKKTLSVLDALFNLAVTVYDFQPESTPVLQNRVTDFTKQLAELDRHKNDVNVRVPLSLIDYVDGGQNPDLHTKELVQTLVDKNQKSSGRIASIKMLSDELKSEVALNYPDLMKQYE